MYINMENISQIAVSNDLSEEEYIATLTDEELKSYTEDSEYINSFTDEEFESYMKEEDCTSLTGIINNYTKCLVESPWRHRRFDDLFTMLEEGKESDDNIVDRDSQIKYYDLLATQVSKLYKISPEFLEYQKLIFPACFINNWGIQDTMREKTKTGVRPVSHIMLTIFCIYILIPFLLRDQYNNIFETQLNLFQKFTLCPSWEFPSHEWIASSHFRQQYEESFPYFKKVRTLKKKDDDEVNRLIIPLYQKMVDSLHDLWTKTLHVNPNTTHLFGYIQLPNHSFAYCMKKNGSCEFFDANGDYVNPNREEQDDKTTKSRYPCSNLTPINILRINFNLLRLGNTLNPDPSHFNMEFQCFIHVLVSKAMATFKVNNNYFVKGDTLAERWPIEINKTTINHQGSCGMWTLFYLFLKVWLWVKEPPTNIRTLQTIFTEFSTKSQENSCYYVVPREENTEEVQRYCSEDIGPVFWFALWKAFRSCVSNKNEIYPNTFLDCIFEPTLDYLHYPYSPQIDPGVAFSREFCVILELLPEDLKNSFECDDIKSKGTFYPLESTKGDRCVGPCELKNRIWYHYMYPWNPCTCKTVKGWGYCNPDYCS